MSVWLLCRGIICSQDCLGGARFTYEGTIEKRDSLKLLFGTAQKKLEDVNYTRHHSNAFVQCLPETTWRTMEYCCLS